MKVKIKLTIDNGDHFALKGDRLVVVTLFGKGEQGAIKPASVTDGLVTWEVEDAAAIDHFALTASFAKDKGGKPILEVQQGWRLDASTGGLVEVKDGALRRFFGGFGHPLLEVHWVAAAGAIALDARLRTSIVDLTDHVLALEEASPAFAGKPGNWASWSLHTMRAARDSEGCDVRVLGSLVGKELLPLVVAIPSLAATGAGPVGAFAFYGPTRKKPDLTKNGEALLLQLASFFDGPRRYLKNPGLSPSTGQPVNFFGPTVDEEAGIDPNCMLAPSIARAGRRMILILTWYAWPLVPARVARDVVRFLWGHDLLARGENAGVRLGRFGIGGFSAGGETALAAIADDVDEVYLFDPQPGSVINNPVGWFLKAPDRRRLRLVSGVFRWNELSSIKSQVASKVADVGGKPNFSFFPAGMLQTTPEGKGVYGVRYYDWDPKRCHPDWDVGARWFRETFSSDPNFSWRAHQWTVVGGQNGSDRTSKSFKTFFGECLALSDF